MKTNIEDYLYKIDHIIGQKSKKDLYLIYVMIFCSILGMSYSTLFDPSKKAFDDEHAKAEQMQVTLNVDKNYLIANPETKIVQIDQDIKSLQDQYAMFKDDNKYIIEQIEKISSLYYNEKVWGQYLNSISQNAKKYNLKVLNFSNSYETNSSGFGHVLDIHVKVDGSYKNTLKFINSIEQSFLVVDLHDFTIKADKKLYTDLNISVWGIN
jgi:Tfp pilus assembly protein PilO